jgi:thiamine pyrophosphate-dependent acetolactate synthase large subunit-like protein
MLSKFTEFIDVEAAVNIGVAAQLDLVVSVGMRYNRVTKSFQAFVSPLTRLAVTVCIHVTSISPPPFNVFFIFND